MASRRGRRCFEFSVETLIEDEHGETLGLKGAQKGAADQLETDKVDVAGHARSLAGARVGRIDVDLVILFTKGFDGGVDDRLGRWAVEEERDRPGRGFGAVDGDRSRTRRPLAR